MSETNQRRVIFVEEKQLSHSIAFLGEAPQQLAKVHNGKDDYVVLTNN